MLTTPADIAIIGGAAGGGKTWSLLYEPIRHVRNPRFGAVIFRRTYPEISLEGGMWDEAQELYIPLGAQYNESRSEVTFPSGAQVTFAHMQHDKDKLKYYGSQIPLLAYDQLETFLASQFWFMLSRNRSTCGVRPYIRASCNPDPDSFVAKLVEWWIDPDTGVAIPERGGRIRWFTRRGDDELDWDDDPKALVERNLSGKILSLTFIPADVYDNRVLLAKDPEYLGKLMNMPLVERERLLRGNWKVRPSAGKLINRAWIPIVEAIPAGGEAVRFWDFAATKKQLAGDDPSFTAGVRMRRVGGQYYVDDVVVGQWSPPEVDRIFRATSLNDVRHLAQLGTRYAVAWEVEPGSASIRESHRLISLLVGIPAGGRPAQGDKVMRGRAMASQAEVGNILTLRAPWTEGWLNHLHAQPDIKHNDLWDATVGAFNRLAGLGPSGKATTMRR